MFSQVKDLFNAPKQNGRYTKTVSFANHTAVLHNCTFENCVLKRIEKDAPMYARIESLEYFEPYVDKANKIKAYIVPPKLHQVATGFIGILGQGVSVNAQFRNGRAFYHGCDLVGEQFLFELSWLGASHEMGKMFYNGGWVNVFGQFFNDSAWLRGEVKLAADIRSLDDEIDLSNIFMQSEVIDND